MNRLAPIAHMAPSRFLRLGGWFARASWVRRLAVRFYPKSGMKVWGIPVQIRKAVTRINGSDRVESVTISNITAGGRPIAGSERTVDVDFVCIAGGLYPLTELAAVIGCPFRHVEELGGHVPVHNQQMETPVDGLFVAGNITGIEGAKVAAAQGRVAGLSIAASLTSDTEEIERRIDKAMQEVKVTRKEAAIQ